MQHLRRAFRPSLPMDRHLRRKEELQIFFQLRGFPILNVFLSIHTDNRCPNEIRYEQRARFLHHKHLADHLCIFRDDLCRNSTRVSHIPFNQKRHNQLILQGCLVINLRQPLFEVHVTLFRSSFGKNVLKIFGSSDPLLVDPEEVMINREENGSEKDT